MRLDDDVQHRDPDRRRTLPRGTPMTRTRSLRLTSATALAVGLALAVSACGSSYSKAAVSTTTGAARTGDGAGKLESSATTASPATTKAAEAATTKAAAPASTIAGAATTTAAPTTAAPASKAVDQQPSLRAGSVDDNADLNGYREYNSRIVGSGVAQRAMDPSGRVVVTVTNADGKPASGAAVAVSASDGDITVMHATANGTIGFFPRAYRSSQGPYTFAVGSTKVAASENENVALKLTSSTKASNQLDVMFVIDATGSMGDEIIRLKSSFDSVANRINALEGQPNLRLAMTTFRDEGDAYVTQSTDFTSDVAAFRAALAKVQAGGGGDVPEAVDEALDDALAKASWRPAGDATQLVFLVGDAGPHVDRQVRRGYNETAIDAANRGIKIFPVASSNSDDLAESVFRQIALATGARFVFLSYGANGAGGTATGGQTDISKADYQELALDDLIVRLVSEEVAARNGLGPKPSNANG
jgi:Mg-chelatase subunit ChlD